MKKCQIETTFFFADVNDRTVQENLKALQTQSALAHFIEKHQGKPAAEMQRAFGDLLQLHEHKRRCRCRADDESTRHAAGERPHE